MFGIAGPNEGADVDAAVQSLGESFRKESRLIVAARPFPIGMEGDGYHDVDGRIVKFRANEAVEKINEIVFDPECLVELEVQNKASYGFQKADCAA